MVKKALGVLAIAAGAMLLAVSVAGADNFIGEDQNLGITVDGPINTGLLAPVLHTHSNVLQYHVPSPPPDPAPNGFRSGPVAGGIDGVLKGGEIGAAIVGPRSSGSIYDAKQQADRQIRRLIRDLD